MKRKRLICLRVLGRQVLVLFLSMHCLLNLSLISCFASEQSPPIPGYSSLHGELPLPTITNQQLETILTERLLPPAPSSTASTSTATSSSTTAAVSSPKQSATLATPPLTSAEEAQDNYRDNPKLWAPSSISADTNFRDTKTPTTQQDLAFAKLPAPEAMLSEASEARSASAPIVIDNDEVVETETTIKYEELPTDQGKTRVKTGAKFPVVISSEITSKRAKKGDPVQGRLKYDLKIGDRLIARKGSLVYGHINYCLKARTILHSLVSKERWYRNSGCLGICFDEIINESGEHLPLVAQPTRQARVVHNKGEGRVLGVNHKGQITGPWSQQLRYKAIRIGLNAALAPAGVFSFGAMPVALGLIGAANPSFAFSKPVGLNVRHRRLKGFAWGFLSGIPGSWLIEDTTVKGQEAVIKPGDEFLAEFRQEFTGEPAGEADLMPAFATKVRGQVVSTKNKQK